MELDVESVKRLISHHRPTSSDQLRILIAEKEGLSYSIRTIRRFVSKHGLNLFSNNIPDNELQHNINELVKKLGISYGRKTLKGALESNGINASQRRIAKCLRIANPENHHRRARNMHKTLNPGRYLAPHFGYNLHIDQNEKLKDYGCVVVMAVDGFSNYLVAGNPELIIN